MDQYDDTLMDEPLWALDPTMMSEIFDTADFKTELIPDNFTISGSGEESIDASIQRGVQSVPHVRHRDDQIYRRAIK